MLDSEAVVAAWERKWANPTNRTLKIIMPDQKERKIRFLKCLKDSNYVNANTRLFEVSFVVIALEQYVRVAIIFVSYCIILARQTLNHAMLHASVPLIPHAPEVLGPTRVHSLVHSLALLLPRSAAPLLCCPLAHPTTSYRSFLLSEPSVRD